jgi:hypothetical protein
MNDTLHRHEATAPNILHMYVCVYVLLPPLVEPEVEILSLKVPSIRPYPEPDESSPYPSTLFFC